MWTAALALTVLMCTAATPPPKKRIAIAANIINRPENDTELGASAPLEEANAATSYAIGIGIVSGSELLESGLADQLRDCGADIRCISARLRHVEVDLALFVVADLGLDPALVTARVVDSAKQQVVGTAIAELGVEGIGAAVRSSVTGSLQRAGVAIGGRIAVETAPANARVIIGGEDAPPGLANVFILPPGEYPVKAVQDGYVETATRAQVRASRDTRVFIELQSSDSLVTSPWFWVALAGVAAAAGGAAFYFAQRSDNVRPLCQTRDGMCEP